MTKAAEWNEHYRKGETPWDSGRPSSELQRVILEEHLRPGRAIDLGCGTGTNAVWLAEQGFEVTGVDLTSTAIERARRRATGAGLPVRFLEADLLDPPDLDGPYDFFFDRGCYHHVRTIDLGRYLRTLERITAPGTAGLVLAGNACEPMEPGPPVVTEEQIRAELGRLFEIVRLREFRFDLGGSDARPLAWSCLLRRQAL